MKNKWIVGLIFGCVIVLVAVGISIQQSKNVSDTMPAALALEQPSAELLATSAFPKELAGISAYVKVDQQINVTDHIVLDTFLKVTQLGKNYVIGVVRVNNNGKDVDVNLYADSSGWIVAYLGKGTPTAVIINWESNLNETILHSAIQKFCNNAKINYTAIEDKIKLYHFAKPNADKLLIFANYIYGPANRGVEKRTYVFIPNYYSVNVYGKPDLLEVSYSLFCYRDWGDEVQFKIDTSAIRTIEGDDRLAWGIFNIGLNAPHRLSLVVTDTLENGDWGGVAVVMLLDEV